MKADAKEAAIAHAIQEFPHESCGLLVLVDDVETYVPCKNLAQTKSEHFVLCPRDYARCEDMGTIVGVVHSHPNEAARASMADQVACETSNLPWYILSVHKDETGTIVSTQDTAIVPTGFKAPLVGRPFAHGVLDCYTLIKDWYKEEMGVELRDYERSDQWWERGEDLYMRHYEEAGFEQVVDETLVIGDVIIMQIRSKEPNHAAVYIGNGQILHHLYGRLSTRDVYGGYWKETTRLVVRRKKDAAD